MLTMKRPDVDQGVEGVPGDQPGRLFEALVTIALAGCLVLVAVVIVFMVTTARQHPADPSPVAPPYLVASDAELWPNCSAVTDVAEWLRMNPGNGAPASPFDNDAELWWRLGNRFGALNCPGQL